MTDSLLIWIAAAVVIGAISLAAQAVALLFLQRSVRQMQERLVVLMPRVETVMSNAEKSMGESRNDIKQVTGKATELIAKANQLMDSAKTQMATVEIRVGKLDRFLEDTTERAKVQVDRVESLVDETVGRARHTVGFVNDTVTRPIREVNAVSAGLRAAVSALFTRRPAGERADRAERAAEETVTHSS